MWTAIITGALSLLNSLVGLFSAKTSQTTTETESFDATAQNITTAENAAPDDRAGLVERLQSGTGL
jgi:hypothetical protein